MFICDGICETVRLFLSSGRFLNRVKLTVTIIDINCLVSLWCLIWSPTNVFIAVGIGFTTVFSFFSVMQRPSLSI